MIMITITTVCAIAGRERRLGSAAGGKHAGVPRLETGPPGRGEGICRLRGVNLSCIT